MNSNENNPFAIAQAGSGSVQVAQTRAAQEVQAAMVIAKKFARNEEMAIERIRRSCQRKSLAEVACYAYPRGGTTITGPSIRLAECLAQGWGNVDFGVIELEQKDGESTVMAYAWDLETNTRETKVFQVKHERRVGKGDNFRIDQLADPRDIYEMVANQGARRLRSCILGIIPGDIVEIAMEECDRTLAKGGGEPLIDRVRKMAAAFNEHGVTVAMLETRLGHKLDATIEQELVILRKIYVALKDGMGKREDYFQVDAAEIQRARFDKQNEAAEAAAGLAPAQSPATLTTTAVATQAQTNTAQEQSKPSGRKSKAKQEPAAGTGAVLAPAATIPVPAAAAAPVSSTTAPAASPSEHPAPDDSAVIPVEGDGVSARDVVLALCKRDGIMESEILDILKRRKMALAQWPDLSEVNDDVLRSLAESWDVFSGQVRIDRKAKAIDKEKAK